MIQASVVAGMVLSRAVVRDLYPTDQAASMIGYVTMGMSVVPMLAPMLGGVMAEELGWQSNFWLMTGLGASIFALCWVDLGETAQKSDLTLGQQFREYPELLTAPRFWGYSFASALSSGAFFSYVGGATFVGTQIFDLSTAELGYFFGAPAVGYTLGNYISGRYSTRFGVNAMVLAGGVIVLIGMAVLFALFAAGFQSHWVFFGLMISVGLGNGLTIPNATAGALSVRPHLAGTASGLSGAIMLAGGALLSQIAGTMLTQDSAAWTLISMMMACAAASIVAIMLVIWREKTKPVLDAD